MSAHIGDHLGVNDLAPRTDIQERIARAIDSLAESIEGKPGTAGYFRGQKHYVAGLREAARIARETRDDPDPREDRP